MILLLTYLTGPRTRFNPETMSSTYLLSPTFMCAQTYALSPLWKTGIIEAATYGVMFFVYASKPLTQCLLMCFHIIFGKVNPLRVDLVMDQKEQNQSLQLVKLKEGIKLSGW